MKIDLLPDCDEILSLAKRSHEYHRNKGSKTRLVWKEQIIEMSVRRLKSEFATARLLGVEPDIARGIGKDPGYDGIFKGYLYECKETEYVTGHLVYNPVEHPYHDQDIWILTIVRDKDFVVNVRGWVWRNEMPDLWFRCAFDRGAWCIRQDQLRSMRKMLDLRQKGYLAMQQTSLF